MLKLKTLTLKNFVSVGNVTQTVHLDQAGLTLILGENLDLGGGGSRNGVGKTTIMQALSFVLYGNAYTNIKKDNLTNSINGKGMVVSLEFEKDNKKYRIERGRKPNFINYYVNDGIVNSPDTNESQGESKWTQTEIERVVGMGHTLFKHIVALHSKTVPFLSLSSKDQRDVIEELLGIAQLSNKAELLKELLKETKNAIRDEEVRIKTVTDSNNKIQKTIDDIQYKSTQWEREHSRKLNEMAEQIATLEEIDIEQEITNQKTHAAIKVLRGEIEALDRDRIRIDKQKTRVAYQIAEIKNNLISADEKICPTCDQTIHTAKHQQIVDNFSTQLAAFEKEQQGYIEQNAHILSDIEKKRNELSKLGNFPELNFGSLEQAINYRHTLDKLVDDLIRENDAKNQYVDQIATLSTSGLQEIDYEYCNSMVQLRDHQEFLLKLLINKDSFIRKKIIDQNLNYLNFRLNHYLEKLALPHEIRFLSDLSVEISLLGKDFDFEQLSNGEANRLVLALSWGFRDVWESMNSSINLLMLDENVDQGMDSAGTDACLTLLKIMARERKQSIFIISHTDGLEARVDNVLKIVKENGFTQIIENIDG